VKKKSEKNGAKEGKTMKMIMIHQTISVR